MKKIKLNSWLLFLLIIVFTSLTFPQSDYETVQNFKMDYAKIEQQIRDADSLTAFPSIADEIGKLRQNYAMQSNLLNKALYPEGFETSLAKLNSAYRLRERDFLTADVLKTEISTLRLQVDTLNTKNNNLLATLEKLEVISNKNSKQISRLNNLISDLKNSLQERDKLVMSMVDSLMPPVMREKTMLSTDDKKQISSDIKKDNILANVKTTIKENIKYLDLTSLQPEDIADIQEQQVEFSKAWTKIGSRLVEVYANDNEKTSELHQIDSLFALWEASVKQEAWNSIAEVFAENGVPVSNFSDGEEFTNSINLYIEKEKNDIDKISKEVAKETFELFADSTWSGEIEAKWTPFLIENGMLAENNKDAINDNIEVWRSELYPSNLWILIIFIGVIVSGLTLLIARLKKKTRGIQTQNE